MTLLAFGVYEVVLFVHILAVVVAFGVTFAYPVLDALARHGHIRDLAALHRFQGHLSRTLITPAMVVVLAAGLYLTVARWNLGDPWISATFAILIVLFGLVGAVLSPTERRLATIAERDLSPGGAGEGALSAEYEQQARKLRTFWAIALGLVVVAIFLMTTKIGA